MKTGWRRVGIRGAASFAATLLLGAMGLHAVDFVRGDANGDRRVSVSDAVILMGTLFWGEPELECLKAGDADDNNTVGLYDTVRIFDHLFWGGSIPAPSPEPGPDPTPEPSLEEQCASYGNGSSLEDPAAEVAVRAAEAAGSGNRRTVIRLAVSSSVAFAGLQASILDEAHVLEDARLNSHQGARVLSSNFAGEHLLLGGSIATGRLVIGFLPDGLLLRQIPPGEGVAVLEIVACLKPGTLAGEYPLTLEAAELSAGCIDEHGRACADGNTGRAILPGLVSGVLHVAADVTDGPCDTSVTQPKEAPFVRGDSNGDIVVNISDAGFTLNYLFLGGGEEPGCEDAADANDDGAINIADPIATLTFLFLGTTRLPAPNVPGSDPTPDWLACVSGPS